MNRIALFASGTGTNVTKLLDAKSSLKNTEFPCVIIDKKNSPLLELIPEKYPFTKACYIPLPAHTNKTDQRKKHELLILDKLKEHRINWIFLAGYLRVLSATFIDEFSKQTGHKRILNLHPSLLPKYPGLQGYKRAYDAKDKVSGVTIHFVDSGLDTGPILKQSSFPIHESDSLENIVDRGKSLEWKLYGEILNELDQLGKL